MLKTSQRVCLVTGGAGFIGSHLVENLVRLGNHVVVIDDLSTGRRANLQAVDPAAFTFLEGKVSQCIKNLNASEFSEIYHLAAAVGVRLVIDRPIQTIETNVHETSALLRFAAQANKPTLVASSSEVYGKGIRTPFSESDDVVYGPTSFSRWSYACSKAIDEYLALAHHREFKLPVVVIRFFNTVGPRQVGDYGMVLPRFIRAALTGQPVEVYGDGEQTRCFCDVRDVVNALPKMLAESRCYGNVFNLGDDHPVSIRALAEVVCDTVKSDSQIEIVPYRNAFGEGFEDLRHRQPDLTRIREVIDFQPAISLKQTILDLSNEIRDSISSSVGKPVEAT